jgi:hypothetical protein
VAGPIDAAAETGAQSAPTPHRSYRLRNGVHRGDIPPE